MNAGPIMPLTPWGPDQLGKAQAQLTRSGVGRRFYRVDEVDTLLGHAVSGLRSQTTRLREQEHEIAQANDAYSSLLARSGLEGDQIPTDTSEQAKLILDEAQRDADQLRAETEEWCRHMLEDTRAQCDQLLAEASRADRTIGHLAEPDQDGMDEAEYAESIAEWCELVEAYVTQKRGDVAQALEARIERMNRAKERIRGKAPTSKREPVKA